MSNRYGESVGKWELKIGGFNKELTPVKGDARRFNKLMNESEEFGTDWLFDNFGVFIKDIIKRDYPPNNKQEEGELDEYVEYNLQNLILETQVRFRWTTYAEIEKTKKEELQIRREERKARRKKPMMQRQQGLNTKG